MAEPNPDRVTCPVCHKTYRWSPRVAGRKAKCAGCQAVIRMPADSGAPVEVLRQPPKAAQRSATGYELDTGDTGAGAASPAGGGQCPACNSRMAAGAVICLSCGLNLRDGQRIQTAVDAKGRRPKDLTAASAAQPAGATQGPADSRFQAPPKWQATRQRSPLLLPGLVLLLVGAAAAVVYWYWFAA